jgi:hypothetical protein
MEATAAVEDVPAGGTKHPDHLLHPLIAISLQPRAWHNDSSKADYSSL